MSVSVAELYNIHETSGPAVCQWIAFFDVLGVKVDWPVPPIFMPEGPERQAFCIPKYNRLTTYDHYWFFVGTEPFSDQDEEHLGDLVKRYLEPLVWVCGPPAKEFERLYCEPQTWPNSPTECCWCGTDWGGPEEDQPKAIYEVGGRFLWAQDTSRSDSIPGHVSAIDTALRTARSLHFDTEASE